MIYMAQIKYYDSATKKFVTVFGGGVTGVIGNLPVGAITQYAGSVAPVGFLNCNGSAVSRATYSDLFLAIGTTYGTGDGSTTFNLPNMAGRVAVGVGNSGATGATTHPMGQRAGEETHVLTVAELALHSHPQYITAAQGGQAVRHDYVGDAASQPYPQGIDTASAGSNSPHNIMQPYTVLNYIIRAIPSANVDTTAFQYFKGAVPANTSYAITAGSNIAFATRTDPGSNWNATNNNWVCPQPGRYRITVATRSDGSAKVVKNQIVKNGSIVANSGDTASAVWVGQTFVDVLDLVAGDTIAARCSVSFSTAADGAGQENTYLIIESVGLQAAATGAADSGWISVSAFTNGWVNFDATRVTQYRKINGIVYLRGIVRSGTLNAVAFNLPAGFRPEYRSLNDTHFACVANEAFARASVNGNGDVIPGAGSNVWFDLGGVFFPAGG